MEEGKKLIQKKEKSRRIYFTFLGRRLYIDKEEWYRLIGIQDE